MHEKEAKAMTLRMDASQARELEKVAEIDQVSLSEAVRDAIAGHIAQRKKDSQFQARLSEISKQDRELLRRLQS